MVFYRKYRPQSFEELLGQETVKIALQKAFQSEKLAHAYLFCGPRGVGKTTTARLLAKMVNCLKEDKDNIPCNKCLSCTSITDGSNLDLIEIDAASNRGIDDVRELRERIKLAPTSLNKKVYIIDEVHMLTTEAFNALLKTLEEPPAHVLFILATTEVHKLPQTILSRVTRLDFQQAGMEELVKVLENIALKEKLEVEKEAIEEIARIADGSFRDCLKLLDQLASIDKKITLKLVQEQFKQASFDSQIKLLEALAQKDLQNALNYIQQEVLAGANLKEFISSLTELLRYVLLLKYGVENVAKEDLEQKKFKAISALAAHFSNKQLLKCLDQIHLALERMKYVSITSLPLEIAIVESCMDEAEDVLNKKLETTESKELKEVPPILPLPSAISDSIPASDDMVKIMDRWNYVLETVKPYNYSLEALLKQVKVLSCESGRVLLEVPYSFHQRILEAPKSRNLLESVLSDVLGTEARVSCVLGQRPVKIEELANVELAADDEIIKVAAEIFNSDTIN